jgi:sugar lactone lactonase YvrE
MIGRPRGGVVALAVALAVIAFGCLAAQADAFVYWSIDGNFFAIGRANLDGSGVDQRFITGVNDPGGVAVDAQHVYWTNTGSGTIGRANLDGSGVDQRFITGAQVGVAVDSQHVYWTNSSSDAIGRANLDGSGVDQSFITGASDPMSVAVDGQHVYWANAGSGAIGRPNLDGSGANQRFIAPANVSPVGVAVDGLSQGRGPVPARVRISAMHAAPLKPGCAVERGRDEREITAVSADATCRHLRLALNGTIQTGGKLAASAGGTITESYRARLPRGPASGGVKRQGQPRPLAGLPGPARREPRPTPAPLPDHHPLQR